MGTVVLVVNYLFASSERRGIGAAYALIEALTRLAGSEGCHVVRWTTRNASSTRHLYDRRADAAPVAVHSRQIIDVS